MLVRGQAQFLHPVLVHEFRAGFAVGLLGAGDLGDALADQVCAMIRCGLPVPAFAFTNAARKAAMSLPSSRVCTSQP